MTRLLSMVFGKKKKAVPAPPVKRRSVVEEEFGPPISEEEKQFNRTQLEQSLNARMKCPAGKNQVFQRSLVTRRGPMPARVALKCHLRVDAGLSAHVFYEHIRDVCCADPRKCEAYCKFKDRYVQT